MMPRSVRTLSIGIYLLIAWKFLTLGAVVGSSAILLTLQLDYVSIVLYPMAAFLAYVGWMAFGRLRTVLNTPYL